MKSVPYHQDQRISANKSFCVFFVLEGGGVREIQKGKVKN
jgi:hypothetical protein